MKERRAGSSRLTAWGERLWAALDTKTPLALGVILLLGFALLVFALQAPLLALIGRRGLVDTRLAEACPARHPLLTRLAAQPAA